MKYLFEVMVESDHDAEDYAQAWIEASRIIQQAPGARGTELHRDMNNPRRLIAIAHWDSKAQRDAMEQNKPGEVAEIIAKAARFCSVTPIGEFDEPEWQVLPKQVTAARNNESGR